MNNISSFSVDDHREEILRFLKKEKSFVIQAPTGAGKTLGIPRIVATAPTVSKITVAVNTNIAAMRANEFSARNPILGAKVVYVPIQTLVTDLLKSPVNIGDVLIVDEFHTNTVWVSALLGILKERRLLNRLRIIFSSATIEIADIRVYIPKIKILNLRERKHPIKYLFQKAGFNPLFNKRNIDDIIVNIVLTKELESNGIIFRPGIKEVLATVEKLRNVPELNEHLIIPIFSSNYSQSIDQLKQADLRDGKTIIVGTNFIESSVTFPKADYVISDMMEKMLRRNKLDTSLISERSAHQRAGRVGRTKEGRAYFLIGIDIFQSIPKYKIRDVERANIDDVVLHLLEAGLNPKKILLIDDDIYFDIETDLYKKGLITQDGTITTLGIMTKSLGINSAYLKMITHRFESMFEENLIEFQNSISCIAMCAILAEYRREIMEKEATVKGLIEFWWIFSESKDTPRSITSQYKVNHQIWMRVVRTFGKLHMFMLSNSASYNKMNSVFGASSSVISNLATAIQTVETVFRETQERMIRVGNNLYLNDDEKYYQLSDPPLELPEIVYVGNKFETGRANYINLYLEASADERGYLLLGSNDDDNFLAQIDQFI